MKRTFALVLLAATLAFALAPVEVSAVAPSRSSEGPALSVGLIFPVKAIARPDRSINHNSATSRSHRIDAIAPALLSFEVGKDFAWLERLGHPLATHVLSRTCDSPRAPPQFTSLHA